MPRKIAVLFFSVAFFILFAGNCELKAQLPDYKKLAEANPNGSAGMPLIIEHLERSGTVQPLEELVRWARTGFPEFNGADDHGAWQIDISGFLANYERSLYYFMTEYDGPDKGARYLRLIEELRKPGYFTYGLTQSANRFLTDEELETEFYRLFASKDPEERARAFVLGRELAVKDQRVAAVYLKAMKDDANANVRGAAIAIIATVRGAYPREITLTGLDRLLHDPEVKIRDAGGIMVRQTANLNTVWTPEDISMLLSEMRKSRDVSVRKTLAMTLAKLTTDDKALSVNEEKWNDSPQEKFIALMDARENELKRGIGDEELVDAWKEWWTPLIEKYMAKRGFFACG